jgi:Fe-S-cluster containining protein
VALKESEIAALRGLDWSGETAFDSPEPVTLINGHPFIAHRDNGDCIYLNPETSLCRIHSRFGESAKPLGCRVYPFNLASTYPGEASATLRLDCPAVQQNHGQAIAAHRRQLEDYAAEMNLGGGLDSDDTSHLCRASLELILGHIRSFIRRDDLSSPVKSLALARSVTRLEQLGESFLNDTETLEQVMPSFLERSLSQSLERHWHPQGGFSRLVFRQWLGTYLRRDEEMVGRPLSARLRRTLDLVKIALNRGNLASIGSEHSALPLVTTPLFPNCETRKCAPLPTETESPEIWEPYWRCVESRLECLQFFGISYYGAPFFMGFRALASSYALVLAAARCHAWEREPGSPIQRVDVEYAIGTIDHGFGRSRLLQTSAMRSLEVYFFRKRYGKLLASLGWQ